MVKDRADVGRHLLFAGIINLLLPASSLLRTLPERFG
jgi:hypothetical protein